MGKAQAGALLVAFLSGRWWNMTMRAGDCAFIPRRWPGGTGGLMEP